MSGQVVIGNAYDELPLFTITFPQSLKKVIAYHVVEVRDVNVLCNFGFYILSILTA